MRKSLNVVWLIAVGVLVSGFCANASAGISVNWATGGGGLAYMGNTYVTGFGAYGPYSNAHPDWGNTPGDSDKAILDVATGMLDLTPGVPLVVAINPLRFQVGWTGDMDEGDVKTNDYALVQDLTVNGVTQSLTAPLTHMVTYYFDSLQLHAGSPLTFGNVIVTPLGWDTALENGGGETQATLFAEFLATDNSVPEPGTILAWLGFAGIGLAFRRHFRRQVA